MGMFLREQDRRSELQTKVAADLQERLAATKPIEADKPEPAFNERQHHTRTTGVVLVAIVVAALITVIILVS